MSNDYDKKKIPTVLIATGTMNAGGAETLIMEILRRKSDRVNYIMLIHDLGNRTVGVYDEEIKRRGIPMEYIHSVGSVGEKKYIREFSEVIKRIGHVDILHSHLNAVGGIIAKAAKKAGIKSRIVHCHANITFKGSKPKVLFNEIKLSYLKLFVKNNATERWACSEQAAKRLFNTSDGVRIIPNAICVKDYLPDMQQTAEAKKKFHLEGKFVLGSIGRIARIKNYELVVRTLAELKKRGKDVEFICFGRVVDEAYYKEIVELATAFQVIENMNFAGNSGDIPFDIRCIDLLLMPSYSEGFGMAALEAQAAGIPVLVSEGVPKVVDMGLSAVSFLETTNETIWAEAIMQYTPLELSHKKILEGFDKRGFNSETMIQKIESYYHELASG